MKRLSLMLTFLAFILLLSLNTTMALISEVRISSSGTINVREPIETGLRTEPYQPYIRTPEDFIAKCAGRLTMIYNDVPWPREIFANFDPGNLDSRFLAWPYTFRDYVNFFRVLNQNGIEIVLALHGSGGKGQGHLDFFAIYPNSSDETGRWINPDYVDPSWGGKTFLEVYAERLDTFVRFVGVPVYISFEDWRYPDYMMTTERQIFFRNKLMSLDSPIKCMTPAMGMNSARSVGYNSYGAVNAWAWEFINNTDCMTADMLLSEVIDKCYHSSMNVVGWLGGQMSPLPREVKIILKLYWGWKSPPYDATQMARKLKDIILASYLTRIVSPEGEYCPVGGFIITYRATPEATLEQLLEVLRFAQNADYLRYAKVVTPILKVPRDLGEARYSNEAIDPMNGYEVGKGLTPMRFVHEDYLGSVPSGNLIVSVSKHDYSSNMGVSFSSTLGCTWLGIFEITNRYFIIFHDGGYEGYDADLTSYRSNATVTLNNLTLVIPADNVTIFDEKGNIVNFPS